MKRNKPFKIKRYRRSFSGAGDRKNLLRRIGFWCAVLAVVFGLGWLIAKPGLDLASSLWYGYKNKLTTSSSSESSSTPSTPSSQSAADSGSGAGEEQQETDFSSWASVALSSVDTPEKASALAGQLAGQGVTHAVLTLKDDRGYLYYSSAVPMAANAISSTTVDAAAIADAFRQAGITPVAGLCAFKDSLAPYADRSAAVKYLNQDILWLDTSAELGGKPWLNPNAASAQQYIADLIAEVRDLGFETVLIQNLQFPEGNGLDLAGYGDLTVSRQELLAQIGQRYQSIEGVEVWFEFPAAAILGQSVESYGASPAGFGLQRVIARMDATSTTNETGEATTTDPASDSATLTALLDPLRAGGVQQTGLRLVGMSAEGLTAAADTAEQLGFDAFFSAS